MYAEYVSVARKGSRNKELMCRIIFRDLTDDLRASILQTFKECKFKKNDAISTRRIEKAKRPAELDPSWFTYVRFNLVVPVLCR